MRRARRQCNQSSDGGRVKKEPISIPLRKHFGFKPLCGERAESDQKFRENYDAAFSVTNPVEKREPVNQ